MSILQVANVQFETTGANRIEYTGNNVIRVRANGGFQLPFGTTAQRAPGETGLMRYNTDTGLVETYGSGAWAVVPDGVAFNAAFTVANAAYSAANAEYTFSNTIYAAVNSAFGVINAAYTSSNADYAVSNAAFAKANTALQNTSGIVFNGTFNIGGNNNATLYVYDRTTSGASAFYRQGNITRFYDTQFGSDVIVYSNTGRVGIGTTTPASPLNINGFSSVDTTGADGKWTVRLNDSTSMAAGVGAGILFQGDKGVGTGNFGAIAGLKENATSGNESGYLAFYTTPNSTQLITERMRIDSAGNVGIGTTSPNSHFEISKSVGNYWNSSTGAYNGGRPQALTITNITSGGYDPVVMFRQADQGGTVQDAGAIGLVGTNNWATATPANQTSDMYFLVRNNSSGISERMRITSAGSVGIGKIPTYKLDVQDDGGTIRLIGNGGGERIMINSYSNSSAGCVMSMYKARGTIDSPTGIFNGDYAGLIRGFGADSTGAFKESHRIGFYYDAAAGSDDLSGYMRFWTRPSGTGAVVLERMRIHSSGGVSIGNTTDPGATNLSVTGTVADGTAVIRPLVLGTSQATTSGTAKDFSIPTWATRFTVIYQGISLSGSSALRIRLGTSGGFVTTGYTGGTQYLGIGTTALSAGFDINGNFNNAGNAFTGHFLFTLVGSNTWVCSSTVFSTGAGTQPNLLAGYIALGGTLTQLRVTTVNGTDTFDAGLVNVLYE